MGVSSQETPLFPLSNVVLFPRGAAPLHIFEPRYRQMVDAALESNRVIAMVTVRPEHSEDMGGDPPIYDVGCAGFIQNYQKLADGRYNLVLQGTHRVRIESETPTNPERLYRVGQLSSLEDPLHDARQCARLREKVVDHLCEIVEFTSELSVEEAVGQFQDMDPASFTDGVCQSLGLPAAEKQGLLEADSIDDRLVRLESALAFHRAMLERGGTSGEGPTQVH